MIIVTAKGCTKSGSTIIAIINIYSSILTSYFFNELNTQFTVLFPV